MIPGNGGRCWMAGRCLGTGAMLDGVMMLEGGVRIRIRSSRCGSV